MSSGSVELWYQGKAGPEVVSRKQRPAIKRTKVKKTLVKIGKKLIFVVA
jgi:hypothetical protein